MCIRNRNFYYGNMHSWNTDKIWSQINQVSIVIFENVEWTKNAWQSLAYSPLGVIVLPSNEYLWNTPPNYWLLQCLTATPQANLAKLSIVKLSTRVSIR